MSVHPFEAAFGCRPIGEHERLGVAATASQWMNTDGSRQSFLFSFLFYVRRRQRDVSSSIYISINSMEQMESDGCLPQPSGAGRGGGAGDVTGRSE
jgi:hypothetical protein